MAIRLTATDMGPATATRVTATLITPLSDALSMPPLFASGVIGATEPGEAVSALAEPPHEAEALVAPSREAPGTASESQGFFASD